MRVALLALFVTGCTSHVNPEYCLAHPDDRHYCPAVDASVAADAAQLCVGTGSFALCVDPPTAPVMLPADLDTDLSTMCLPAQPPTWKANGQPEACVVVGTSVTIQNVVAHGGRSLVVIASDTITVTNLDVSSKRTATTIGAGYDPTACGMFAQAPGTATAGGGGAGGTFVGSQGGDGGTGNGTFTAGGLPAVTLASPPTLLRGGCPGQNGGVGMTNGGVGGVGGGAVYLVAAVTLDLTGATINASGAGGSGGGRLTGGGGGGSGGMIILRADTIGANGAILLANGGSGAAGGNGSTNGNNGADPDPTMPTMPAVGGLGAGGAGPGGNGFAGPTIGQAGIGGSGGNGGGGGGAGPGYIQSNRTLATTMVSPTLAIM